MSVTITPIRIRVAPIIRICIFKLHQLGSDHAPLSREHLQPAHLHNQGDKGVITKVDVEQEMITAGPLGWYSVGWAEG